MRVFKHFKGQRVAHFRGRIGESEDRKAGGTALRLVERLAHGELVGQVLDKGGNVGLLLRREVFHVDSNHNVSAACFATQNVSNQCTGQRKETGYPFPSRIFPSRYRFLAKGGLADFT